MQKKPMPFKTAKAIAQALAGEMHMEFVDAELVKEPTGLFMRFYIDKFQTDKEEGGISLDELEAFHKALRPKVEDVEYDYMEVSSPGLDRPLKTERDFERAMGSLIEVKLYKAQKDQGKLFRGTLTCHDANGIHILPDGAAEGPENELVFADKDVAVARCVIEPDEDEMATALNASETQNNKAQNNTEHNDLEGNEKA